jgi:hypothetical protein
MIQPLSKYQLTIFSPEDRSGIFLRNVGIYVQVYTALQPRITTLTIDNQSHTCHALSWHCSALVKRDARFSNRVHFVNQKGLASFFHLTQEFCLFSLLAASSPLRSSSQSSSVLLLPLQPTPAISTTLLLEILLHFQC